MDINCIKCGYYRGKPNLPNCKFICSRCKNNYDDSIERAEKRLGA